MGFVRDIFSSPKTPAPVAPTIDDAEAKKAAQQEQLRLAKSRGRASTVLTGAEGDTGPTQTAAASLLGG